MGMVILRVILRDDFDGTYDRVCIYSKGHTEELEIMGIELNGSMKHNSINCVQGHKLRINIWKIYEHIGYNCVYVDYCKIIRIEWGIRPTIINDGFSGDTRGISWDKQPLDFGG